MIRYKLVAFQQQAFFLLEIDLRRIREGEVKLISHYLVFLV